MKKKIVFPKQSILNIKHKKDILKALLDYGEPLFQIEIYRVSWLCQLHQVSAILLGAGNKSNSVSLSYKWKEQCLPQERVAGFSE